MFRTQKNSLWNLAILENQLLLATLFRMMGSAPVEDFPAQSFSTFLQYFFYPVTITGPWVTFSSFCNAKSAENWDSGSSFTDFGARICKFLGETISKFRSSCQKNVSRISIYRRNRSTSVLPQLLVDGHSSDQKYAILELDCLRYSMRLSRNGPTVHFLQLQLCHCFPW